MKIGEVQKIYREQIYNLREKKNSLLKRREELSRSCRSFLLIFDTNVHDMDSSRGTAACSMSYPDTCARFHGAFVQETTWAKFAVCKF